MTTDTGLATGARTLPFPGRGKGRGGLGLSPLYSYPSEHLEQNPSPAGALDLEVVKAWDDWEEIQKHDHSFHSIFCTSCGEVKDVPVYCKNRFCPVCSVSRKFKIRERLQRLLTLTPPTHSRTLKLLTLTIQSSIEPRSGIDRITNAFKRMRQLPFWKKACCNGAWVIEVTGEPKRWHVHIHAIVVSKYIRHEALVEAWKKLTGAFIVDIRIVSGKNGINYITKYITKGGFDPKYIHHVATALRSVRLINCFGSWHNAKIPVVKLVSHCPHCQGVRWQSMHGFLVKCTDAELQAWLRCLRDLWDHPPPLGGEG